MDRVSGLYRWSMWRLALSTNTYRRRLLNPHARRVFFLWLPLWIVICSSGIAAARASSELVTLSQVPPATVATEATKPAANTATPKPAPAQTPAAAQPAVPVEEAKPAELPGSGSGEATPPLPVMAAGHVSVGDSNSGAKGRYTPGQCTYYVASKRNIPGGWGNARTWKRAAENAGYKTGNTPAVGAVAWTSAGWYGHVAYVEAVSDGGATVTISEMNYRGAWRISKRTVSASTFSYIY